MMSQGRRRRRNSGDPAGEEDLEEDFEYEIGHDGDYELKDVGNNSTGTRKWSCSSWRILSVLLMRDESVSSSTSPWRSTNRLQQGFVIHPDDGYLPTSLKMNLSL